MHLGGPVVPDEYMMNRGWLKGTCANSSTGLSSANLVNSGNRILQKNKEKKKNLILLASVFLNRKI